MVTVSDSIATLQKVLRAAGDEKTRVWWTNYVKGGAPFLGVKMAAIRRLVHHWHEEHIAAAYDSEQERELALALLRLPHSEEKLAGVLQLQEILIPTGAIRCPDHTGRLWASYLRQDTSMIGTCVVGWVLREVSRQDPAFVRAFVEEHEQHFSSAALKNALKVVGPG